MSQIVNISTVTPVYAGQDYLESLVRKLAKIRDEWSSQGCPFALVESIFVNDDSTDDSDKTLEGLVQQYSWVKVVTQSKNFGQHPATIAGILHTSGEWIITLDEDLQHDPENFTKMIKLATTNGSDIIYAKPEKSVHQSFLRDWGSYLCKRFVKLLANNQHIEHFNSYRLIRGTVGRAAASVCSHETYLDIALCWFTNRIKPIYLPMKDCRFIETGKSAYSLYKLIGHFRRMLVSSQTKLLRIAVMIGGGSLLLSLSLGAYVLVQKLLFPNEVSVQGWTSLILVVVFFGGLLSFMLGVVLEYLAGITLHTQGKPVFFTIDRSSDVAVSNYFNEKES